MSARARERERENKREKIEEYITTNLQGVTSIMKCPSHAIARETRREIKLKRKKNIQRPASKRGEKKKKTLSSPRVWFSIPAWSTALLHTKRTTTYRETQPGKPQSERKILKKWCSRQQCMIIPLLRDHPIYPQGRINLFEPFFFQ